MSTGIKLWSRGQGFIKPPDAPLYVKAGQKNFPETFRVRATQWSVDALTSLSYESGIYGEEVNPPALSFRRLLQGLCAAYGRNVLVSERTFGRNVPYDFKEPEHQLPAHTLVCPDNEVIDYIDAVFQTSAAIIQQYGGADPQQEPFRLGAAINILFEEEGVGYRWVAGQLVRFDDDVAHKEAVAPAVELLASGRFGQANAEFSRALETYRAGHWRDAITNANASFESVLKVLTGKPSLQAGQLIREAKAQGLVPGYLDSAIEHLEKLMHAVPAIRGQESSSHGHGDRESAADQALCRLVITLTAGFIAYLGTVNPA